MAGEQTYEQEVAAARITSDTTARKADAAGRSLEAAIAAGDVTAFKRDPKFRVFVAPVERNTKFLINPTERKIETIRDASVPMGQRDIRTTGDVWVQFSDGIMVIDTSTETGQRQLAWCSENPTICRDADDPMTAGWAAMKEAQLEKINAQPSLDKGVNVDALLSGSPSAWDNPGSLASRAREIPREG